MVGNGPPPFSSLINTINSNISTINISLASKAITFDGIISIAPSDWSNTAPYTCTKTVSNIFETDKIFIDINLDDYSTTEAKIVATENWVYLSDISATAGKITFTCLEDKPEVALSVLYKVIR